MIQLPRVEAPRRVERSVPRLDYCFCCCCCWCWCVCVCGVGGGVVWTKRGREGFRVHQGSGFGADEQTRQVSKKKLRTLFNDKCKFATPA